MIYFISDTHFNHKNIIKFCDRPFQDVKEMNDTLIRNWNKRVQSNDTVYHLGDFAFGMHHEAQELLYRLNGNIQFVKGNHDEALELVKVPSELPEMRHISANATKLTLCHYPLMSWPGSFRGSIHLFGHVHANLNKMLAETMPEARMLDVGVDSIAEIFGSKRPEDYRPISIQEVLEYMKEKKGLGV